MRPSRWNNFLRALVAALLVGACAQEPDSAATIESEPQLPDSVVHASALPAVQNTVLLDSAEIDLTGDSVAERVELFVRAERLPNGRVLWEDGHSWLVAVRSGDRLFRLLDGFVPWGTVRILAIVRDESLPAVVIQTESSTGGVAIEQWAFSKKEDGFVREATARVQGRVVHSTSPAAFR